MQRFLKICLGITLVACLGACNKYLNVVPDNAPTTDIAFQLRSSAEKVLFTCYSYIPPYPGFYHTMGSDPALVGGQEIWMPIHVLPRVPVGTLLRGGQNIVNPLCDYWTGGGTLGVPLYKAIRYCNLFLSKIGEVPNMDESERNRWISEVKFLKAYYLFCLVRMYGPVVLPKELTPISTSVSDVKKTRAPVDSCFSYIVQLMDEALPDLPDRIEKTVTELGRITKAIDLSVKAYVLVTAASPLFNGNPDYKNFTNFDGTPLFSSEFEISKWEKAAEACKEAVQFCQSQGFRLHYFNQEEATSNIPYTLSDTTITKLTIRTSVTKKWNSGVIWALTNRVFGHAQALTYPRGLDPERRTNATTQGYWCPPVNIMSEIFGTNHGLPLDEDTTWDYAGRFELKQADSSNMYNIQVGYTTAKLHFDRDPRFYANVGFDGGLWYGQGKLSDTAQWVVMNKVGQTTSAISIDNFSVSGYFCKAYLNINTYAGRDNLFFRKDYPWPIMRLDNLYLLYAEALNEAKGPGPEVYRYIDSIRTRIGLPTVEEAWTKYTDEPNKFKTKDGLREIIHEERNAELAFEGKRFWDLRRWGIAVKVFNQRIEGWNIHEKSAEKYYQLRTIYAPSFSLKDIFWPISERVLVKNPNIVQNPGWGRWAPLIP